MQTKNTYKSYSSKICRNEALNCQPYRLTAVHVYNTVNLTKIHNTIFITGN